LSFAGVAGSTIGRKLLLFSVLTEESQSSLLRAFLRIGTCNSLAAAVWCDRRAAGGR
jgi:hypothetical protein